MQNLAIRKDLSLKTSTNNEELTRYLASLEQQLEAIRAARAPTDDSKGTFLQREFAALQEPRSKLAELTSELEEKRVAAEGLRGFAFKFVSELYKHIQTDNDQTIHDLFFHLSNEKLKGDRPETGDGEDEFAKLFKTYNKTKATREAMAKGVDYSKRVSKLGESLALFKPVLESSDLGRRFLGAEMVDDEIVGHPRVVRLSTFHQLKRKSKNMNTKQLIGLTESLKGRKEIPEEGEGSLNSEINESVLSDLENLKPNGPGVGSKSSGPRKRDFTTIKISFKIDIQNAPTKPDQFLQVKKDRIYRTFHLREMLFHLMQRAVCGVQLTFLDLTEGTLFVGELHGVTGDQTQKITLDRQELIDKIHFGADAKEIHHIEFVTTLGKHLTVGKSRKDTAALGVGIVNRYFSDKDILYSFFGGFNRKTRRIAYLRFLFVRKNMLK